MTRQKLVSGNRLFTESPHFAKIQKKAAYKTAARIEVLRCCSDATVRLRFASLLPGGAGMRECSKPCRSILTSYVAAYGTGVFIA